MSGKNFKSPTEKRKKEIIILCEMKAGCFKTHCFRDFLHPNAKNTKCHYLSPYDPGPAKKKNIPLKKRNPAQKSTRSTGGSVTEGQRIGLAIRRSRVRVGNNAEVRQVWTCLSECIKV